jgi:chromosome segregation ATPase
MTAVTEEHLQFMAARHRKTMEKLDALKARFSGASDMVAATGAEGSLDTARIVELRNEALRKDAHAARADLNEAMQVIQALQQHLEETEAELSQRTSLLRSYNREATAARIETRVAEAREAERASIGNTIEDLRSECVRLRSENNELRASKKKLREALERLKEKR